MSTSFQFQIDQSSQDPPPHEQPLLPGVACQGNTLRGRFCELVKPMCSAKRD